MKKPRPPRARAANSRTGVDMQSQSRAPVELVRRAETDLVEQVDDDPENQILGERIRELRKSRNLSLQALGERCGLSVALISQIERGVSSPSMRSLRQIASAFGLPVAGLFMKPDATDVAANVHVMKHTERRLMHVAHTGISMELLTTNDALNLRAYYTYIVPGGSSGTDPDSHVGSETGVILTGQMDLWLGDKKYRLDPGDSFTFDSRTPHRYSNPGHSIMHAYWVVSGLVFFNEKKTGRK